MDVRDLEKISKVVGELGDRLEQWEKVGDAVSETLATLIREIGRAAGRQKEEIERHVTEQEVSWSVTRGTIKAQLEEARRSLLNTLAEMIKRGDC